MSFPSPLVVNVSFCFITGKVNSQISHCQGDDHLWQSFSFYTFYFVLEYTWLGLPWWLSDKESACNAADTGLIPGSGRSPGQGDGNLLHYFCLGDLMDRGAWQATGHGVAKESDTTEWLIWSDLIHTYEHKLLQTISSTIHSQEKHTQM